MAELFASLSEFKPHVGGAINQTVDLNSLAPVIADTARRHLVPYLGQEFYDDLVANASTPSTEQAALLPYVRRSLALLTMHEYAKIAGMEFGESGMYRIETENRKSAYRYQEKQYSEYMLVNGYEAMEGMLHFLDDNITDYGDWANTNESMLHLSPLLNYASDIRRLLNVQCDRYTFETLRPIIAEVQHFGVERLLPRAFWSYFIQGHEGDTLSAQDIILRTYIRSAIAHRAYEEAIRRMAIRVANGRIYTEQEFGEQSQVNRTTPNAAVPGQHMLAHDVWADRHTAKWKDYIISNNGDFPLVFDIPSEGDNADADAWHINTEEEDTQAALDLVEVKKGPVFRF